MRWRAGLGAEGEEVEARVGGKFQHLEREAEVADHGVMEAFGAGPQLKLAALGEDGVPVGALLLAKS